MLKLIEVSFGVNSRQVAEPLNNLINVYRSTGRPADADRLQERLQSVQAKAAR
jgi:hypothetical protein